MNTNLFSMIGFGLIMSACLNEYNPEARAGGKYKVTEQEVGHLLYRFENKEVTCYYFYRDGGMSCKWKEAEISESSMIPWIIKEGN